MKAMQKILAAACAVLLFAAPVAAEQVEATITYRERMTLPPDAELQVALQDVSRMDAPAKTVTSASFPITAVPVRVPITYDPAQIDQRMVYALSAQIISGETVLFRSTSSYSVLTRGAPSSVEMVLERMPADAGASQQSMADSIAGIDWAVTEIGGRALIADDPPSMAIDTGGKLGLFGGCNRYEGQVKMSVDGAITFPDSMPGTLMACAEPRMKLEKEVLTTLTEVTGYARNGSLLSLTNAAGVTVMRFQERPE